MSHVKVSFEIPEYVGQVDALGTLRILEAVRLLGLESKTKIYQASTSELYGGIPEYKNKRGLYDENSSFHPKSPYGVAKLYAFWIMKTTVKHIKCSLVMEYYLITNLQEEVRLL